MITLNRNTRFTHSDYSYGAPIYTEYLFGSIGLKVNANIRVDVEWHTLDVNMTFAAVDDSIERLDGSSDFFADGFRVGDTVAIEGTALNNMTTTISSFNDDFTIMYVAGALTNETVIADIYGDTPIISMDFFPNLIGNNTDFVLFNLTDRETIPRYYADTITTDAANPTVMQLATNSHGWVSPADAATIYRLSFTSHVQTFVISHTFTILPLFLADQLTVLQRKLPPAAGSLKDRDCLKYVYTIDGKFTAYDPEIPHTTDGNVAFPKGQTGWYNEFINGRPTTWTKESIYYYDNATGGGLTAIDYCKVVDVDAILQCQTSTVETLYIVHVLYLPLNEDRYVNTRTDWKTNFIYERAVVTLGGGPVQGENTGDYHFLKDLSCSNLGDNRVKFDFQIDFSQTLTDFFDTQDSDNLNYLIFITASTNL